MNTLYDIGQAVVQIREAVDSLEVKGEHNASIIVYCFKKCNDIIAVINEAAERVRQEDEPHEQDSGSTQ